MPIPSGCGGYLRNRFPAVEILEAFSIFDPHNLPANAVDELGHYGNDKLSTLLDHYQGTELEFDTSQTMQEWQMLCSTLTTNQHLQTLLDVVSFICNPGTDGTLPQLKALAVRALLLPVSTADCERGFSCMNRVVTPLRNWLKTENIDKLLRTSAKGTNIDTFYFDTALSKWSNMGKHRIDV